MSIRQLRTLAAIVDFGSFAGAADALGLTQSAVSMQITALEEALGATLFDRSRRPPLLSRQGDMVLKRARGVIAQYDGIFEAPPGAGDYRGGFRLGAIPTVLTNLLPAGLMILRRRTPELVVSVTSDLSGRLMERVAGDTLDAAIMQEPDRMAPGLSWRPIVRQRIVVVAPPESEVETAQEAFDTHPYIRFDRGASIAPLIEERLARMRITPDTRAEIGPIEAIHLMVRLGFGVSVLPEVGGAGAGDPPLRILDLGSPPLFRAVGMLTRREQDRQPLRRVVADAFAEAASTPAIIP